MTSASENTFYHQTKTSINFWYRQKLNFRFLIQPYKTLLTALNLESAAFSNNKIIIIIIIWKVVHNLKFFY